MTLRIQKTTGATLRLNRGSGTTWKITPSWSPTDSDAAAYIAAVEQADGQALENGVKVAFDNFVRGCKADGIWNAIKASCILAGARTLSGALVPLAGPAPAAFNFVGVGTDYNRKLGLSGDGTSKYINAGFNNSDSAYGTQNDKHICVYTTQTVTVSLRRYFGGGNTTLAGTSGAVAVAINATSLNIGSHSLNSTTPTLIAASRANTSIFTLRTLGTSISQSRTSVAPTSGDNYLFYDGTNFSNFRAAFYSYGFAVNLAVLDARVGELINAITAAIP